MKKHRTADERALDAQYACRARRDVPAPVYIETIHATVMGSEAAVSLAAILRCAGFTVDTFRWYGTDAEARADGYREGRGYKQTWL